MNKPDLLLAVVLFASVLGGPKVLAFSVSSIRRGGYTGQYFDSKTTRKPTHACRQSSTRTSHWNLHGSSSQQETTETDGLQQEESTSWSAPRSREKNVTVTFPSYNELQYLEPGDFVTSSSFTIESPSGEEHEFCVLLYPRGGGHSTASPPVSSKNLFGQPGKEEGGFGMGYKVVPMFSSNQNDKVGVYLKYLPKRDDSTVDVTFSLRLKGRQSSGSRFDVEWNSGMRFVSKENGNLRQGVANDFGAHVMQSNLLSVFLGVDNDQDLDADNKKQEGVLEILVQTMVHSQVQHEASEEDSVEESPSSAGMLSLLEDIRRVKEDNKVHNVENVRVGKIVVPVLNRLSQRRRMFELGAYPGVEYRIMNIYDSSGKQVFVSEPDATYELKPIYPLVSQLERNWPISIKETEIPKLFTSNMYNVISALGSVLTAAVGLTAAFVISQVMSLFFIPSKSMDPTLQVGDVLLVDKLTPRITARANGGSNAVGDVVLFSPPKLLQDIVKSSGGKQISSRDLFVKRVAAGPGDEVTVDFKGSVAVNQEPLKDDRGLCDAEPLRLIEKYIQPMDNRKIKDDDVFVMGDCSSVSVDSRVWGPLPKSNIVGRPLMRIWPLERFGAIPDIPSKTSTE